MDKIKPVAWMRRWAALDVDVMKFPRKDRPPGWGLVATSRDKLMDGDIALYDQSAIDALRAEVMQLRELCRDMLPVFEAARPLVLNLERLKEAASGGSR